MGHLPLSKPGLGSRFQRIVCAVPKTGSMKTVPLDSDIEVDVLNQELSEFGSSALSAVIADLEAQRKRD